MSLTLLDVVQRYLNSTDGFFVSSINQTEEAQQVALIAKEVYGRLVQKLQYRQFTRKLETLDGLVDLEHPNYLLIKDSISRIEESTIYYNCLEKYAKTTINWKKIEYLDPLEFLNKISREVDDGVNKRIITDFNGVNYVIYTDRNPSYCTSFDGKHIIFNSYNKNVEDTMHASKSMVVSKRAEEFLIEDSFIIPLPEDMLEGFVDMVKAEASETLRQEPLPSASIRARAFEMSERFKGDKIGNRQRRGKGYGRKKGYEYKTKTNRI